MFRAELTVEDPNARAPGVLELLRRVWTGDPPLPIETMEAGLAQIHGIVAACSSAGFTDAVNIFVGDSPTFVDEQEHALDADTAMQAVAEAWTSPLPRDTVVSLVLSARGDGLHSLVHARVRPFARDEERRLEAMVSSRWLDMRVTESEDPGQHRARVRSALSTGGFDSVASAAELRARALAGDMGKALGDAPGVETLRLVVAPGPTQVGRFRSLGFGEQLRARVYGADQPRPARGGPYDDPHVHHYYDPYHDLLSWWMVEAAADGTWTPTDVRFVNPAGEPLPSVGSELRENLPVPLSAVTIEDDALTVDDAFPVVGFHPAEAGSPHAPGYGGENA